MRFSQWIVNTKCLLTDHCVNVNLKYWAIRLLYYKGRKEQTKYKEIPLIVETSPWSESPGGLGGRQKADSFFLVLIGGLKWGISGK